MEATTVAQVLDVEESPVSGRNRAMIARAVIAAVVLATALVAITVALSRDDSGTGTTVRPAGSNQTPARAVPDDSTGSPAFAPPASLAPSVSSGVVTSPPSATESKVWTEEDMRNAKPYDNGIPGGSTTPTSVDDSSDNGSGSVGGGRAP